MSTAFTLYLDKRNVSHHEGGYKDGHSYYTFEVKISTAGIHEYRCVAQVYGRWSVHSDTVDVEVKGQIYEIIFYIM